MNVRFRSIDTWPYDTTPAYNRKGRLTFKASWSSTLDLLDRELHFLSAADLVIECFLRPSDIRLDGWPRADARYVSHPGVALHFDTPSLGHLRYATDVFEFWQHNVRAIALGLEALRKVDRYGITRGGEQYRGFAELPSGGLAMGAPKMTLEDAAKFICRESGLIGWGALLDSVREGTPEMHFAPAYRMAAKRLHPDNDGDADLFQKLQEAKRLIEAHGGGS